MINETQTLRATSLVIFVLSWLSAVTAVSQPAPPGVPEPGLVIWGTVVNVQNPSQGLAITSASWSVSDGTRTAVFDTASRPAVRIVNQGGQSFYVLEVPFDTRTIGPVSLSDPASTGGPSSFELKSGNPPVYSLTPTINGVLASVRAVDGLNTTGNAVPISGFNAGVRGRVIRVDLSILPPADPYDAWAAGFFGSLNDPRAGKGLDPDGDGFNNESEYLAGTDPKDKDSVLKILTISPVAGQLQVNVQWQSATGKKYKLEGATQAEGPFREVGAVVPGTGGTAQANVARDAAEPGRFYRVRLVP
ncbi:MAG: hypothetical protein JNN07_10755 [Verrucomicrobiales bacterium]|nr:hypothetical protein [Verrucomicrobiales bacterium]